MPLSRNRFQLFPASYPFCPSETSFTFRLVPFFPSQGLKMFFSCLLFTSHLTAALSLTLFFLAFHYLSPPLAFHCLPLILQPLHLSLPGRERHTEAVLKSLCPGSDRNVPAQGMPHLTLRPRIWCIRGGDQPFHAQGSHILKSLWLFGI